MTASTGASQGDTPGVGVLKTGFGVMDFGGTAPNSYASLTQVNEGVLQLNKPAGVNAIGGALLIGDDNWDREGVQNATIVRWMNNEQMPDAYVASMVSNIGGYQKGVLSGYLAAVGIEQTGLLDLNGYSQGIGTSNSQWAIVMEIGGDIQIGADASGGPAAARSISAATSSPSRPPFLSAAAARSSAARSISAAPPGSSMSSAR